MRTVKQLLKIGEVARQAGTTVRTVRFYLEEGLIEHIDRSDGGFYLFEPEVVDKVKFIRKLKELGMSLKEIKSLYDIRKQQKTGDEAYKLVLEKLKKQHQLAQRKAEEYMQLKKEIEDAMKLVNECAGCRKKPNRKNCTACEVLKEWDVLPSPFGAIL